MICVGKKNREREKQKKKLWTVSGPLKVSVYIKSHKMRKTDLLFQTDSRKSHCLSRYCSSFRSALSYRKSISIDNIIQNTLHLAKNVLNMSEYPKWGYTYRLSVQLQVEAGQWGVL